MELFVVEITAAPARAFDENVARVVDAFKVDATKATRLLERINTGKAPVTVSRPSPERDAQRTARNFASLGFEVRVRPYIPRVDPDDIQPPVARPEAPMPQAPIPEAPIPQAPMAEAPVAEVPMAVAQPAITPATGVGMPQPAPQPAPSFVAAPPVAQAAPHDVLDEPPTAHSSSNEKSSRNTRGGLSLPFLRREAKATPDTASHDLTETITPMDALESSPESTDAQPSLASIPATAPARLTGRVSLRRKFLIAAILPTLLTVASAVAAIFLTVPGALRGLLLESARNPAIALADGVGGLVPGNALEGKAVSQIQDALNLSRATFYKQNVQFVMVTDAVGNPLAGWYGQEPSLAAVPAQVRTYVQTQARRATARAFMEQNGIPLGTYNPPSRLVDAAGTPLEVAAHPIIKSGTTIGNTVVGMSSQVVAGRVTGTLITTLLASTLPVILAILIALWLARTITTNVLRLVRAADRISLGELSEPVGLRTNDELNELGEALERMRVSLQESLERLRRRRR